MANELLSTAIEDFRAARTRAALKEILARFTGEPTRLLSYDEVREKLRLQGAAERGLKDIPLDAIVGSVGRYADFTRDFLPLHDSDQERWARVKIATSRMEGLPPIEVYQIGEVYFVRDGNHRVSVARSMGATHIQAYVTEVRTRVPLTPDIKPDDLIIKAEYADFLEKTRLDELRPEANLQVTVPGKYEILLEHIAVHRYFMGIDFNREIAYEEAVAHWYDEVYMPLVRLIRERGILHYFPDRTETDLYLWIAEHQAQLQNSLGWQIKPEKAVSDLVSQRTSDPAQMVARLGGKFLTTITFSKLEAGPPPGEWRKERLSSTLTDRLFADALVPVNGTPSGWSAVDQAIVLAQREGTHLQGLHVTPNEQQKESADAKLIQEEFNRRCAEAGVQGELAIAAGDVTNEICGRSRFTDLVIPSLNYPPGTRFLSRLSSGFRDIIQRCPRPVLAVPGVTTLLSSALLAYDGSPKAHEALFVATYRAEKWKIAVTVVTVLGSSVTEQALDAARSYLEAHQVEASYVSEEGPAAPTIIRTAVTRGCDFIIMGGYGRAPVMEVVLGSSVDQVLRESNLPILICR